jgi:hypothetical protein
LLRAASRRHSSGKVLFVTFALIHGAERYFEIESALLLMELIQAGSIVNMADRILRSFEKAAEPMLMNA